MSNKNNFDERIDTKFGKAYLNDDGYYELYNSEHNSRLLHRLVYEEEYGEIPDGYIIHHIDGNPSNYSLDNLMMVSRSEHNKIHHNGKECSEETRNKISNSLKGKKHSPERIRINSEAQKGKKLSDDTKLNISTQNNTTGYFRVSKAKNNNYKQGFYWVYSYYDDNNKSHRLSSVDLNKLEDKVIEKGLPWKIINKSNANKTSDLNSKLLKFCKYNKRNISGVNNPFYGKKHSTESRKKMSESKKKGIY